MSSSASSEDGARLVLATVGTDHHKFDRLVRWVDRWAERRADTGVRVLVQSGPAAPPGTAEWTPYLGRADLEAALDQAVAVVCHGGPGTIVDVRKRGLLPIVIPREHRLEEAVDDHQIAFASRLARSGEIRVATTEEELTRLLDEAVSDPEGFRTSPTEVDHAPAVSRLEELVTDLFAPEAGGATDRSPVPVLLIGGMTRSGSTLLERMVAQVPGFCSVGELVYIWSAGYASNDRCGCGAPFDACPFWEHVGEEVSGGWDRLDAESILERQRLVIRHRYIPFMLAGRFFPAFNRVRLAHGASFVTLYRALQRASGMPVIVDSSKDAPYAFLLWSQRIINLRLVHLVRDSRGVAYSWTKQVKRPEATHGIEFMHRYPPWRTAVQWGASNALFELLRVLGVPTMRLRYESLVSDPRGSFEQLLRFAGHDPALHDLSFIGEGAVDLEPTHTVSGNPMRFKTGTVPLRVDDEWTTKLPFRDRAVVTAITWPLLLRYGYRLRQRR